MPTRAQVDREFIRRRGFREFVARAWHTVEPMPYVRTWSTDAIAEHLEAVSNDSLSKLLVTVPPGSSKSLIGSVLWPVWHWAEVHRSARMISATYTQELSNKSAELIRQCIESPWFSEAYPELTISDKRKVSFFKLSSGGWHSATSVRGRVTGDHAHIIKGDDLIKAQDATGKRAVTKVAIREANDFWEKTLSTRMADPVNTKRVLIMQRLHFDDPAGRAIDDGYENLMLPMRFETKRKCVTSIGFEDPRTAEGELLNPERFPERIVSELETRLGDDASAQLQQDPAPPSGRVFKDPAWRVWSGDKPPDCPVRIVTVDASFKAKDTSDFCSVQSWGRRGSDLFLVDRTNARMEIDDLAETILAHIDRWRPQAVHVEDKANGPGVMQRLKRLGVSIIEEWSPGQTSKEERAAAAAPTHRQGRVWIPSESTHPWVADWKRFHLQFPLAAYDDDVDAASMAIDILDGDTRETMIRAYQALARGRMPPRR